jgi:hypothetical protein
VLPGDCLFRLYEYRIVCCSHVLNPENRWRADGNFPRFLHGLTMRHIELIGLPAAGKTTMVENLQHGELARERTIIAPLTRAPVTLFEKLSKRFRDLVSVSRQLLGSPFRSRRIWRACGAFRQPSTMLRLRMYLSCLRADSLARSAHARANEYHLIVLDQGIYQTVWSLALRAEFRSRAQLLQCCRRLLGCLALPGQVILIDTPADIARQRLVEESDLHGRLPRLLESDPGWMLRAQEILDGIWEIASDEPLVKTLRYTPGKDTLKDVELAIRQFTSADEQPVS